MIFEQDYPNGTEHIVRLLETFPVLDKEQIELYLMQRDKTFNKERASTLIDELIERNFLYDNEEYISLYTKKQIDIELINAFWVFLSYVDKNVVFDEGRYPAAIVFKEGNTISEIIVCDDDFTEKMDFLSKRKKRKNECKYYLLITDENIKEVDEELFPDTSFTVITMQDRRDSNHPKLMYHEVFVEEN